MADFTQAQLNASLAAFALGSKVVKYADREIEYRSLDELQRIIDVMKRALGQSANNGNRFSLASTTRS